MPSLHAVRASGRPTDAPLAELHRDQSGAAIPGTLEKDSCGRWFHCSSGAGLRCVPAEHRAMDGGRGLAAGAIVAGAGLVCGASSYFRWAAAAQEAGAEDNRAAHPMMWRSRKELGGLRVHALQETALEEGVAEEEIDAALESDDCKAALVECIVERRRYAVRHAEDDEPTLEARRQLDEMKMLALQESAKDAGVDEASVRNAMDSPCPKTALVSLCLRAMDPAHGVPLLEDGSPARRASRLLAHPAAGGALDGTEARDSWLSPVWSPDADDLESPRAEDELPVPRTLDGSLGKHSSSADESLQEEVRSLKAKLTALHSLHELMGREDIFTQLDPSGSGAISRDEMRAAALKLGRELSELELEELMSCLEQDGEGNVVYDEFVQVRRLKGQLRSRDAECTDLHAELSAQKQARAALERSLSSATASLSRMKSEKASWRTRAVSREGELSEARSELQALRDAEKATADANDEDKENKADKQAAFWKTFEQMEEDEQLLILEKAERRANAGDGAGAERAAEGSAPDVVSLG